jgi:reductive dehalogenase
MAATIERVREQGEGQAPQPIRWVDDFKTPPDYGRSARVVGHVESLDPNDGPHPKNARGELGKALFNFYRNSVSKDPLSRVSGTRVADRRNVITEAIARAPQGEINPSRTPVTDPEAMTRHIKNVGEYFGADIVAVAKSHPAMLYAGKRYDEDGQAHDAAEQDGPEELAKKYPYLIFVTTAWDYDKIQAHRHHVGDAAYHVSQMKGNLILRALEGYIKELGYNVVRGAVNGQAAALAAGVGELGRNGLVITEKFGARVHMPSALMTDLPLTPGKPIDIGVPDFCAVCRKCAVTCPTNSITFGDKVVFNGVEKYKINWLTCYRLRPYVVDFWTVCLTCVTVCPFTKPNTWWHSLAVKTLKTTPIRLRPPLVKTLKAIDDRFWGVMKNKRVRWMGYDSGIKPGEKACTIAGCTANHDEAGQSTKVEGNVGYYAPLKENTNRFVKRDG